MTDNPLFMFVLFPVAAYLIGSTPVGVLIARSKGIDLRAVGSGNMGATNVARILGRRWGYLCFFCDVAKGFVPVLAAGLLLRRQDGFPTAADQAAWLAVGFGAIAGHVFSFYLRFRGGKGVATALGVVLGIYPYFTWPGLCAFAVWIAVTLVSRYVSLGSIVAACAFLPLFALFNRPVRSLWPLGAFAAAMVVLLIWRHRTNLQRLLKGEENKIGRKG
jgi:glycerol-3-phosphate acyltransferase PlsY